MRLARLIVLFVTAFVDMVGLTMIVPLLPYYATEFGASALVVGLLISAFSIAQLLSAPGWGRLSDRYGRRPAILAGLAVTAAAYVLFAFAGSIPLLLAARLVQGLGGGTIGVVQAYVADTSSAAERTKSLGWLSAVTSLGAVAGPAMGSGLDAAGGPRAVGLGAAALALLVAAFAWRFLRESRTETRTSAAHSATTGRAAIRHVLTHADAPASRLIWIYTVAIGAFYGTIQTVPLLLAERLHVTEHSIGYFIMYLGGLGVVVRSVILGRLVDRLDEARLARLGIVTLAAGLACTGIAHSLPVVMLGFTLMPFGTAFLFPCVTGLLSESVRSSERGLYMGVQHTFGGVSRVAFPITAGLLMDGFGVGVPFWISALLVLATLPLAAAIAPGEAAATTAVLARRASRADITGEFPTEVAET
jgi:MFS family permease